MTATGRVTGEPESFSSFDERSPMELVASEEEVRGLLRSPAAAGQPYLSWVAVVRNTTRQTPRMPELPYTLATSPPNASVDLGALMPGSLCGMTGSKRNSNS